jgi:hypothetical protein
VEVVPVVTLAVVGLVALVVILIGVKWIRPALLRLELPGVKLEIRFPKTIGADGTTTIPVSSIDLEARATDAAGVYSAVASRRPVAFVGSPPPPNRSRGTVSEDYPYQAKDQIEALVETLQALTKRDPEQEVQGIALPVLDAVIESVRAALPDDPVVKAVRGIVSPEQIALGEPIRAAEALLVAKQLDAAVGPYPPAIG